jgi:hypothetical protein
MSDTSNSEKDATGQIAFVELAQSIFSTTKDTALTAFGKLRSFMRDRPGVERLYQAAQAGGLRMGADELFERVRDDVVKWDLGAIARQVIMPLASGYLGYAAAVAAGLTGGIPVLIGFLIGAVIWLAMAPGTWRMLKARIAATIEEIFSPVGMGS